MRRPLPRRLATPVRVVVYIDVVQPEAADVLYYEALRVRCFISVCFGDRNAKPVERPLFACKLVHPAVASEYIYIAK